MSSAKLKYNHFLQVRYYVSKRYEKYGLASTFNFEQTPTRNHTRMQDTTCVTHICNVCKDIQHTQYIHTPHHAPYLKSSTNCLCLGGMYFNISSRNFPCLSEWCFIPSAASILGSNELWPALSPCKRSHKKHRVVFPEGKLFGCRTVEKKITWISKT